MLIFQNGIVRASRSAVAGMVLAVAAQAAKTDPRPMKFAPAPSSLVLLLAGLAVLLGWNWWRSRARVRGSGAPVRDDRA